MAEGQDLNTQQGIGPLPQIDPQLLAHVMSLAGNGALPPTSPIQPQGLDPQQVAARAMQQGTQYTGEQLQRGRAAGDRAEQLMQQQEQTPLPKLGFEPHMVHGQGVPGFFHNMLQALATAGVSTLPGRAVESSVYGPGIRRYEAETGARAKEIADLLAQEKQEYEPVAATARMGPAYLSAEARSTAAQASKMRAETGQIAQESLDAHRKVMEQLASGNLTEKQKQTVLRQEYLDNQNRHQKAIESLIARGQNLGWDEATLRSQTEQLDAEFNHQAAEITAHPIWSTLFGTQSLPALPSPTAPAISPTGPGANATPPAKARATAAGGIKVTDPRGHVHAFKDQASADAFKKAAGIR